MITTEVPYERYLSQPMWMAEMSNGITVYQNDVSGNSWIELKRYVEENGLYLKNMHVKFRDHLELVGSDEEAYFFINSMLGSMFGYQQSFFVTGYLKDGIIYCRQWIIPELIVLDESTRSPNEEFNKELIISGKAKN